LQDNSGKTVKNILLCKAEEDDGQALVENDQLAAGNKKKKKYLGNITYRVR
jgi:hypothetical protein